MPTNTFFRLPEEKQARLLEASWAEVTQFRFSEISINRIISAARIPRGSFYQYFVDKEDLILYLLQDMREYFIEALRQVLIENEGDLFAMPLGVFDQFGKSKWEGGADPVLNRFVQILKLNQGRDVHSFLGGEPGYFPDPLWQAVDKTCLGQPSQEFAGHVFFLSMAALAASVVETLQNPQDWERQRGILQVRMELLKHGCAAPIFQSGKEETA